MSAPRHRIVAIVGRPNVGKSAMFNRLVRRRVAIVHAESGVTRDRLMREVSWGDERFVLIDTGGVCNVDRGALPDSIESGVRGQVDTAIQDAAVAVLVVDIAAGLTPMDQEVARLLHQSGRPAVVAANKADDEGWDAGADEFAALGLPVFPVSALHDRGFEPLMDAVLRRLPPPADEAGREPLKVAVVGRPNVGKSSYVNRLLRSERVIVSPVPGTTRDSIDVPFVVGQGDQARHYLLIDTAGMRRTGKIDSAVERFGLMRALKSVRDADIVVLMLDAERGVGAQDKHIAAEIMDQRKGALIVVNKWDLAEVTQRQYAPAVQRTMPFMGHCPIVFVSAVTGYNIRRSVEAVDHVAAQVRAELPTGVLNRALLDACARTQPPSMRGRRLKIFYAVQTGVAPLRVRVFVNDPRRVPEAYKAYLLRSLREHFGLEGAFLQLDFRARREGGKR